MRPLSEVFAPGAPTLPERLRTLVVSPERELEPGMTLRAQFTFRNHGGAPATGVRIRFNVPDGLVYLVGSGCLDANALDDELGNSPLLSRTGADVGDVLPNEERRVEIAYSVAGAIENGTTIELQAAVASFELPPVGSNVVRLVARSRPQLRNALTRIEIESVRDPLPGAQANVTIRIHNAGESTARDLVVVAPIPEHTTYVANSARLNGRELERELGTPFDRAYAPVVVRSLPARASATLTYRLLVDSPLPGDTAIVARAEIASQETPAFTLEAASLTITSAPDFNDDRTAFAAEPREGVRPGERVRFALAAFNSGTAPASRVAARIELNEQLLFVRGATTIDGKPLRERRKEPLRFALGAIDAGAEVRLCVDAIVLSPLPDGTALAATALLEWEPAPRGGARTLEAATSVRSEPAFSARHNTLARTGSASVVPGGEIEAVVKLENDGTADAHDGVLHLRITPPLDDVAVFEGSSKLSLERRGAVAPDTVDLGTIDAYAARKLTLRARAPVPCADGLGLSVAASLHTRELGETALPEALWRVDSHPAFAPATSRLDFAGAPVLRPNQLAEVDVVVTNVGTDVAHNVMLRFYISPEARLESVDGATREKSTILFGEIAPAGHARARLGLRLLRGLGEDRPLTIDAVLNADGVLPVQLASLSIATCAAPDFSTGSLQSDPAESVDPGETIEWILHVRNGGDGAAHLVDVVVEQPGSLIYVPNSTTINDVPLRDAGSAPPFSGEHGVVLNDVDPGVEAVIRWRSVVHNALAAGTAIRSTARIRYDGERADAIESNELRVRAEPIFANAIPGLPFGLDGMLGPASSEPTRALTEERFLQLPPATPVGESNGSRTLAQLAPGSDETAALSASVDDALLLERAGTLAVFSAERLRRTARLLREARFGGTIVHLFALRAFLPDAVGDGRCSALDAVREQLREELDRLFIKLRLPNYAPAPRDLETPSLRTTLERLAREASEARGTPAEPPGSAFALRGSFDPAQLRRCAERMNGVPLASAVPWAMLARLLPDEPEPYGEYRAKLVAALDALEDAEPPEFIDTLQHDQDPALDAALDEVLASLHTSAPA